MERTFNYDGPVKTFMRSVGDLIVLNVLFVLFSIPLITIGASLTAMYNVTLKMAIDHDSGGAIGDFLHAFKENFRQSTILWILFLLVEGFLAVDIHILLTFKWPLYEVFVILFLLIGLVFLLSSFYVFPVLAKFENTLVHTIKNAVLLMLSHPIRTILIVVMAFVPALLLLLDVKIYPLLVLFGFSAEAYLTSLILKKVFCKYIPSTISDQESD